MEGLDSGKRFHVKILTSKKSQNLDRQLELFCDQYNDIIVEKKSTKDFHDRFIIIDGKMCYHLGASIKDAGKKVFMINKIEDENNAKRLLENFERSWKQS